MNFWRYSFQWRKRTIHESLTYIKDICAKIKRTIIVKSIDGESRPETSSDIFGELYNPRFRSRFSQGAISRQAQSPETKIPAYGKRAGSI